MPIPDLQAEYESEDGRQLTMAATVQDVFMLFGDSITQLGWQANTFAQRLACAYVRKIDIINRGLSGYNTEWAIPIFEQAS